MAKRKSLKTDLCPVARALDLIDVAHDLAPRWQGLALDAP